MKLQSYWALSCSCFFLALFLVGCTTLDPIDSGNDSDLSLWQPANVIQDARQLVLEEESGQPRKITSYMAARIAGLQPIFRDSLIFPLQGSRRMIRGGKLGSVTGLGESFWPDSRSGAGAHMINEWITLEDSRGGESAAVVLPKQLPTRDRLDHLVDRGTKVILAAGEVSPHLVAKKEVNALVLEVTPSALGSISGIPVDSTNVGLFHGKRYILPEPVLIETWIDAYESPLNMMGLISGRDPRYASQLIIVTADPEWISMESDSSRWIPSAILLELARNYVSRRIERIFPKRSLLVATGTGAALHTVFEYPVWARKSIHAVIMLGRSGTGHVQIDGDRIPVMGYPFSEIHNSEGLDIWITTTLEQIHDLVQQLDHQESGAMEVGQPPHVP